MCGTSGCHRERSVADEVRNTSGVLQSLSRPLGSPLPQSLEPVRRLSLGQKHCHPLDPPLQSLVQLPRCPRPSPSPCPALNSISEMSSWVLPVQSNSSSHLLSLKPLGWLGFIPQQLQSLLQAEPMLRSCSVNSYGGAPHALCLQLSHKLNKTPAHRLVSTDPAEVTTTDTHWQKDV